MKEKSYIQMVLAELGITSYEDYIEKIKIWESFDNRVWHGGQEKIDALRDLVVNYYDGYQYTQLSGQYISINPKQFHDESIANYLCLFPKRALIETSVLLSYIDMTPHNGESYDLPPNDFIEQYFRFQKIIGHNIAHLYPPRDKLLFQEARSRNGFGLLSFCFDANLPQIKKKRENSTVPPAASPAILLVSQNSRTPPKKSADALRSVADHNAAHTLAEYGRTLFFPAFALVGR